MRGFPETGCINGVEPSVFSNRIRKPPASAYAGVGNLKLAIQFTSEKAKCRNDIDVVSAEWGDNDLPIATEVSSGKGHLKRPLHLLKELGLFVSSKRVDSPVNIP